MNSGKIIKGWIAGAIAFFFLGWVIYGILLKDALAENTNSALNNPEVMRMPYIILGNIVQGLFFAVVFAWANVGSAMRGITVGAIIAFLSGLALDLIMNGTMNMFLSFKGIAIDVAAFTVMSGIAGAIIGWAMNMGKKPAAA